MDKNETNRNKRNRQNRPISSYSVDVAKQRGERPAGAKAREQGRTAYGQRGPVIGVDMAMQRGAAGSRRVNQDKAANERQNGRSVDVAEARRRSGRVDVMTGRPLSGRVQVPVDRRKNMGAGAQETGAGRKMDDAPGQARRRPDDAPDKARRRPDDAAGQTRRRQDDTGSRADRRNGKKAGDAERRSGGPAAEPDNKRRKPDRKKRKAQEKRRKAQEKRRRAEAKRRKAESRKPTPEQLERKERERQVRLKKRQDRHRMYARAARVILKILAVIVIVAAVAFLYIRTCYKLKNIDVTGTDHYTDAEMVEIVTGGKDYGNTLLFLFENQINPPENVTFIDKIDVEYVDRNSVSITVYEKAMAGCIEVDGQYAYFDGDGTVLEISDEKLDDVPCIEGLTSDNVQQGEKLSVGDESFFQEILTMTQLIYKNNIDIDKISCDDGQNLILHRGGIKIKLGSADNIEEKFRNLDNILDRLDGLKGTLDMSNYTEASGNAVFKENK